MDLPKKINLGSGKNFRPDYLNIDINDYWSPDIVADVSRPLMPVNRAFATARFGAVVLESNAFDEIIANDVLEHIAGLVSAMTNCLDLLRVGGVFNILVPYDLSCGAWQDPTHVRAFNERSWLYYTDWFWYLGWQTHRFQLRSLEFVYSPEGQQMRAAGQPVEAIIRSPRAVDAMQVALEKIVLSDQDRQALATLGQMRESIARMSQAN